MLTKGSTVRESVLEGRREIEKRQKSRDLANYMHYGDPAFVIKDGRDN